MRWIALITAITLAACAASPPPDKPECAKPEKPPIDGGLGGTGKAPEDPCAD